jgi:hypothetical protein
MRVQWIEYGWILPDGTFLPCRWHGHREVVLDYFKSDTVDVERRAECLGWAKLTRQLSDSTPMLYCQKPITKAQLNTLFDWCQKWQYDLHVIMARAGQPVELAA